MFSDNIPLTNHRLSTVGDVRRALNPLQEQADRVGRQVEQFAETLDRLNPLREGIRHDTTVALQLIKEYEKIAGDTVNRLKRRHGNERKQALKHARRRLGRAASSSNALVLHAEDDEEEGPETGTTLKDLAHWENEQHTWELLSLVIQTRHPVEEGVGFTTLARPANAAVHRYSSQSAVYDSLLGSDDVAWESEVVAQWLCRVANLADEDVYDVVEDYADIDGGADAIDARGWIAAKENIKQQKRMQSLNRPLDANAKQPASKLSSQNSHQLLVTQLDPDAPTRQGRHLPKQDLAFEYTLWMGCWELVKRGRPWSEILDWCKDRAEAWRALALRPSLQYSAQNREAAGDPQARAFWQQTCMQLASSGGVNDYERAVYGLLGGDEKSVFKICSSWNDHLFAFISCNLARKYNNFFCERLRIAPSAFVSSTTSLSTASVKQFIRSLASDEKLKAEARSPFIALQAGMITHQLADFIIEQGSRLPNHLAKVQYGLFSKEDRDPSKPTPGRNSCAVSPDDYEVIRVLAHIALVYAIFDPSLAKHPAAENFVVAYIDYLGKAGKQQLLPLYASLLSKSRASSCMARQLIYIKDTTERQTILRLMNQFGLDYNYILISQLAVIINEVSPNPKYADDFPPMKLLQQRADQDVPTIKPNFMGDAIRDWETDLIDALEWFLLIDGQWEDTFAAGTTVYKHFLRTQSWAAASELARRIPFSRISRMKTRKLLGAEVDLSQVIMNGDNHVDEEMDEAGAADEAGLKATAQQDELLKSSKTFQDFESFVIALDAISHWENIVRAGQEVRSLAQAGDKSVIKGWKKELQPAYDNVTAAVEPLLQNWLTSPKDENEAVEISQIRKRVLPEVVLAYLSIQFVGCIWLHREYVLYGLNLARVIASPEHSDLCDVFVEAGRMAELMTIFANLSRQALSADEATGNLRMKRRGDGEQLGIWTIRPAAAG